MSEAMDLGLSIPKIRVPYYSPTLAKDGTIRMGTQYPLEVEINDPRNEDIWKIMELIDGKRSVLQIIEELQGKIENPRELVLGLIESLTKRGIIYYANSKADIEGLDPVEVERYARNSYYFSWILPTDKELNYEPQLKLKNARVTIVGMGGIGSSVAVSLAATGVGHIHLVDFDIVEISNLNRQILYSGDDIGKSKVKRASEKLSRINSLIDVTYEERKVNGVNDFAELMKNADVLVLGADKPVGVTSWCNEAALEVGTPWITGGYFGPKYLCEGYIPHQTGCTECYKIRYMNEVNASIKFPYGDYDYNASIAPTSIISAQLIALDVIHYIVGFKTQFFGKRYIGNALSIDLSVFQDIDRVPSCPKCGESVTYAVNKKRD